MAQPRILETQVTPPGQEVSINSTLRKSPSCKVNEKGSKTFIKFVRTLFIQRNTWTFHLRQELYDINFQANTKDFQSHGNECEADIIIIIIITTILFTVGLLVANS